MKDALEPPRRRERMRSLRALLRKKKAKVAVALLTLVSMVILYGFFLSPYPERTFPCFQTCSGLPPFVSLSHPLGTYPSGQDVFSEIAHGAPRDLFIGLSATGFAALIGVSVGLFAGTRRGTTGYLLLGLVQVFILLPAFVFVVWLYSQFGYIFQSQRASVLLALVLGGFGWPPMAMAVRNEVLRLDVSDFVLAERALGASTRRILSRHIFPNLAGVVLALTSILAAANLTTEVTINYLLPGSNFNPPDVVTWGLMISEGTKLISSAWWVAFFPGLMLVVTVLGLTLLGDSLSEVLSRRV